MKLFWGGGDFSIYKSSTYSVGNGVGRGVSLGEGVEVGIGVTVGFGVDVGSDVLEGVKVNVGVGVPEGVTSINFFFQGLLDPEWVL
jgi:hypothetical protein